MPAPVFPSRPILRPLPDRLMPVALLGLALALGQPAAAQTTAPSGTAADAAVLPDVALAEALQLPALFAVLRDEGLAHGAELEAESFPSGGGPGWAAALAELYDAGRLEAGFVAVLAAELGDDPALPEILAFFASDLGLRVVGYEIDARRAFLDPAAEDAARVAADRLRAARDPRAAQIDRFIAAGNLLEMNVAGALSGNLAFVTGLNAAGVYGPARPEAEILAEVWGQEAQIRDDTRSWLTAYLGLAYAQLDADELDRVIAFWDSPAGQRLNAALFLAFDSVFRPLSQELGHAAGLAMLGRDI
jgi:hypothetical protein